MKKLKEQKGITLIALIITIVILLILAVVTINAIQGDGIIQYAKKAQTDYTEKANEEQEKLNTLLEQIGDNIATEEKEAIPTTQSYVGYYADVDGNGSVDGIIYADLAVDGSGEWGTNGKGVYSYSKKETLNNYYISQEKYKYKEFAEKPVIAPIDKVEENDRFYVMALEDFSTENYFWYHNATEKMSDYATTTSGDFGKGKENTKTMMSKVYGDGLKEKDMWKHIGDEVSKGWFVPSSGEWSAFGVFANGQGVTIRNYEKYGLTYYYWSSSQYYSDGAWSAKFCDGYMGYGNVAGNCYYVRLSTTF